MVIRWVVVQRHQTHQQLYPLPKKRKSACQCWNLPKNLEPICIAIGLKSQRFTRLLSGFPIFTLCSMWFHNVYSIFEVGFFHSPGTFELLWKFPGVDLPPSDPTKIPKIVEQWPRDPGYYLYIGDEILPVYIGIIIGHYKDPYQPTSIMECQQGFERCLQWI